MKHLAVFAVAVLLSVPAFAGQDQASFVAQGRIAYVAVTHFPDGSVQTDVTLNLILPQDGHAHQVTFTCDPASISCPTSLLGSCSKSSVTAIQDSPEGVTTYTTTQCMNPAYADCWSFSGYMTPHLWASFFTTGPSCLF